MVHPALLTRVRERVLPSMWSGNIAANWASRTTARLRVGLSVATHQGSLPIAYRL
jgi:hypothetical protein